MRVENDLKTLYGTRFSVFEDERLSSIDPLQVAQTSCFVQAMLRRVLPPFVAVTACE